MILGEPADNAAHFFEWMQNTKGKEMENVKYAVFGCGNRDWVRTYQKVPKIIDSTLEERGGRRLHGRGEGDAQAAEFFQVFDVWEADLWKALAQVGCSGYSTTILATHTLTGIRHCGSGAEVSRQWDSYEDG